MRRRATSYAVLAAALYAVNIPFSKRLLLHVSPTMMAALLYLGAGLGLLAGRLAGRGLDRRATSLTRKELPYTAAMVALDIAAPILLMLGVERTTSANVSLLSSFEIVATSLIALVLFREVLSRRLVLLVQAYAGSPFGNLLKRLVKYLRKRFLGYGSTHKAKSPPADLLILFRIQYPLDSLKQVVRRKGLQDIIAYPQLDALYHICLVLHAGQHDDRDIGPILHRANLLQGFKSVLRHHADVQQDQIGLFLLQVFHRPRAGAHRNHIVVLLQGVRDPP